MQGCLCSVICVFSQNHGLATKGAGIELTILVNIFVLKLATHAHNANREMNFLIWLAAISLGNYRKYSFKLLRKNVQFWLSFNSIPTSFSDLTVSSTAGTNAIRRLSRSTSLFHVLRVIVLALWALFFGVWSVSISLDGLKWPVHRWSGLISYVFKTIAPSKRLVG